MDATLAPLAAPDLDLSVPSLSSCCWPCAPVDGVTHDFFFLISNIVRITRKLPLISFLVKTVTPPLPEEAEGEDTVG